MSAIAVRLSFVADFPDDAARERFLHELNSFLFTRGQVPVASVIELPTASPPRKGRRPRSQRHPVPRGSAMRLPDRFDYVEERMGDSTDEYEEWYPVVYCTDVACDWAYHASWLDLGRDGDVDWDAVHPAHNVGEGRST